MSSTVTPKFLKGSNFGVLLPESVVSFRSLAVITIYLGVFGMTSPQPEKRNAPRKNLKVPAKVHSEGTGIDAEALNLSQSGIFCFLRKNEQHGYS